jgi:hypothetical protein
MNRHILLPTDIKIGTRQPGNNRMVEKEMPQRTQSVDKGRLEKKSPGPWRIVNFLVIGAVLAIGAVILGTLVLIFHKSASPNVHVDPAAAKQLEAKLHEAEIAARNGAPQVLRVDEREINSILDSRLAVNRDAEAPTAPLSVRDVKINLIDDRMRLHVILGFHGKDMTLDFEGKLRTENGYLQVEPVSGTIGAIPIPRSSLESAVRRMMDSAEGREQLRLPNDLRDFRINDGKIVLTYK